MDEDLLREFLIETYENLDKLDADLLALEKSPDSKSVIDNIFRMFHSCKGGCGFIGLSKLEAIAHTGENLLGLIRDKKVEMNSKIIDALLSTVDTVRKILNNLESIHGEGNEDHSALLTLLNSFRSGRIENEKTLAAEDILKTADGKELKKAPCANETATIAAPLPSASGEDILTEEINNLTDSERINFENIVYEILVNKGALISEDIEAVLAQCRTESLKAEVNRNKNENGARQDHAGSETPENKVNSRQSENPGVKSSPAADDQKSIAAADMSIRVNIELLDKLMNLVGELVLARNQFLQLTSVSDDPNFIGISQRLNLITSELQEGIMKTRMQPINNIWRNFGRIVREVSASINKKVRLEMEGKETELDKTIIEAIKDPLTHILRNSIDHGIEEPEKRREKKKDEEGLLLLRAFHEGGQVNIEITDDGNGINLNKVKQKAIERELINASQASVMSEREVLNLIFLPGFSTAEKVTNISGRGVGMDVVRKNIEKIGGTVDIESRHGSGTSVKIKIPLTLAIIPALIVTSGGDNYAIPQVSLLEVVRLKGHGAKKGIEEISGALVYRLRGKLLPLVYLNEELKIGSEKKVFTAEMPDEHIVNIIVLQAGDRQFGLIVDAVNDTEEIVVKPLDKFLKSISVFAGATVRGDGRVALILDILGLAKMSGVISELNDKLILDKQAQVVKSSKEAGRILLFKNKGNSRMAIDLSKVSRLENFSVDEIEQAGGFEVVQYRGQIMPLVYISKILPERRSAGRENGASENYEADSVLKNNDAEKNKNLQVVVYSDYDKSVGVVVDSILDIVETDIELQKSTARAGVIGSGVILNKVTEILDMDYIIKNLKY